MSTDLRICFLGESFVAGVGDPRCLGWAGRLSARAIGAGHPLTAYNLGIRRETSAELRRRWADECKHRLTEGDCRVVISTGVNDSIHQNGQSRVRRADSKYNMAAILDGVRQQGWQALVVSPPPNVDEEHNARIAGLDETFNAVCQDKAVPYLRLHQALKESTIWMQSVAAGDGYHPGEAGYDEFASLLAPFWLSWLGEP